MAEELEYVDERGWKYRVRAGIGSDCWKAHYQKPGSMGWHGVKSKDLPWRKVKMEAEADLVAWAEKKGLNRRL